MRSGPDECSCTVAEHQGQQVETTDEDDCPSHGLTSFLCGRHRVEAHEHVWQTSDTEHQRQAQRDEVELLNEGATVLQTRFKNGGGFVALFGDGVGARVHVHCVLQ